MNSGHSTVQPESLPKQRLSLSLSLFLFIFPSRDSLRPFFSYSFTLVLPFVLWFKVFLFARARIATDDEGVLLFPRDLHKISILGARPGKNIGESRGPDDESLLLKPALLALTYTERVTKEKSLFSRLGPISRLRPAFSPPFDPPRPLLYIADPPANSRSPRLRWRFTRFPTPLLLCIVSSCSSVVS